MSGFQSDEPFELPVNYKGKEIIIPGVLKRRGYSYKMHVDVGGQEIIFEPDEERNFRAIQEDQTNTSATVDIIRAIGEALEKYLR